MRDFLQKPSIRFLGLIGLAFLGTLLLVGTSWAGSPADSCDQVEIVLLVDQSGSMGGKEAGSTTAHPRPNDPLKLRFYGPLFAARWLGNDFLVSQGIPGRSQVTFHMAVVNFGDNAEVALDWTTLAPKDQAGWKRLEDSIRPKLVQERLFSSNLGNTNFLEAFNEADKLFAQRDSQRGGCPRRAIVLMTDGEPSVDEEGFTIGAHMDSVGELVKQDLPSPGYRLYITGINDPDKPGFWELVREKWETISQDNEALAVRRTKLVFTPDEVADRFSQILFELKYEDEPPPRPTPGPYVVPPYLQELDFVFFKRNPESEHLDVSDGIGPLTPSRTDVEVEIIGPDEPIETLRVRRPLPGIWTLETTADRADVLINAFKIPTAGILKSPLGAKALQFVRTSVEFQLVDSQGQPLPEYADPRYEIQITGTVRAAGRSWPISVRREAQQAFTTDFVPVEVGEHTLTVRGISQDSQGSVVEVLNGDIGAFLVEPVRLAPQGAPLFISPAEGCPLQVGDQAVLHYQAQSADGQPVVLSLPLEWETKLTTPIGGDKASIEGPDTQGVYTATVVFDTDGSYSLTTIATLKETDGTPRELLADEQAFEVAPIRPLKSKVHLVEPVSRPFWWRLLTMVGLVSSAPDQQIARDPLGRWLSTEVQVLLVGQDGQTVVDPTIGLRQTASFQKIPLVLIVTEAGGVNAKSVTLTETEESGRYRATIDGLELGEYELRVEPANDLVTGCGYGLPGSSQTRLNRVENPWIIVEWVVAGGVVVLVLLFFMRRWCSRRNSCKGYITVLDTNGLPVDGWFRNLRGQNRWRLHRIPARTGIQEILIRSTEGRCGRQPLLDNRVYVKVWPIPLPNGQGAEPFDRTLSPGEQWKPERLPGYTIWYVIKEDWESVLKSLNRIN